jgi:hypothetical protein
MHVLQNLPEVSVINKYTTQVAESIIVGAACITENDETHWGN